MFLYIPVKQTLENPDLGCYVTYGIQAFHLGWGLCAKKDAVGDVSTSFYEVASLAAHCTLGQLDPIQLIDVCEDFVCR